MRNAERELITLGTGWAHTNHVQFDERDDIIQRSSTKEDTMKRVEKGRLRIEVGTERTLVWQEVWVNGRSAGFTLLARGNHPNLPQRGTPSVELFELIEDEPPPEH